MRQHPPQLLAPKLLTTLLLSLGLTGLLSLELPAAATDLPPGVMNWLQQKDTNVRVRFDGLVLFSNGETYVPIIPQEPSLGNNPQQVIVTLPEQSNYPDLVEFDNHFFLLRLIQTSSGRLTFPKLDDYPVELKEGLLPQDFVLPANLFIPVELKVILGALPYNPHYAPPSSPPPAATPPVGIPEKSTAKPKPITNTTAKKAQSVKPAPEPAAKKAASNTEKAASPRTVVYSAKDSATLSSTLRRMVVFDLIEQRVLTVDPATGRRLADIALGCVPSGLELSTDGSLLFAPCLSTNELAVVDIAANLVKTRIPVGQRPDGSLYLAKQGLVVVSNRYSPFLSVVDTNTLLSGEKISLPGSGGPMAAVPGDADGRIVVADSNNAQAYVVNMTTLSVERTLKTLPGLSAIWAGRDATGKLVLWTVSRTKNQVQVLDLASGAVEKTLDVGLKPIAITASDNRVYVVAAGSDRLEVIDRATMAIQEPVTLPDGSFPSGLAIIPSEKRLFLTTAGESGLNIINLETGAIENALPVEFRASIIALPPDSKDVAAMIPASDAPAEALPSLSTPTTTEEEASKPIATPAAAASKANEGNHRTPENTPKKQARRTKPNKKATPSTAEQPPASKPITPAVTPASALSSPVTPGSANALPVRNAGQVTFSLGGKNAKKPENEEQILPSEASVGKPAAIPIAPPPMMGESVSK